MKRSTAKRIFLKIVVLHLVIHLILTRFYFWDVHYYWSSVVFQLSYVGMWFVSICYMLIVNLCYCIFMVFQPGRISKCSRQLRRRLSFLVSFCFIAGMHFMVVKLLFAIAGSPMSMSDYLLCDYPFFIAALAGYILFVYRKPERSLVYTLMWNTYRGGIRMVMDMFGRSAMVDVGYTTMTLPMSEDADEPVMNAVGDDRRGIRYYDIVLFYFSKSKGSYVLTTSGEKIFIAHTSSILRGTAVESWFVKISKYVYLNMWYFTLAESGGKVLLDRVVWRGMARNYAAEDGTAMEELIQVSKRCKPNVAQHFNNRDHLDSACWNEVMYY